MNGANFREARYPVMMTEARPVCYPHLPSRKPNERGYMPGNSPYFNPDIMLFKAVAGTGGILRPVQLFVYCAGNLRREEQIISGGFPEHKGNGNADDCYGKKNREEGYNCFLFQDKVTPCLRFCTGALFPLRRYCSAAALLNVTVLSTSFLTDTVCEESLYLHDQLPTCSTV